MHQTGVSYAAQGYHLGDGVTIPAWKVDEHLLAAEFYGAALEEKHRRALKQRART